VTDPSGAPVAAAHVQAVNAGTGYRQTVTTSSSGLFQLPLLPLGKYSVTVDASGFTPYRRTDVIITAGCVATVDVAMQLKGVSTEVLVESGTPLIDVGRTDVGSTLSSNAVDNLPLVSRNPYNFILQQPNVSGHSNTEFGVPRKVNARVESLHCEGVVAQEMQTVGLRPDVTNGGCYQPFFAAGTAHAVQVPDHPGRPIRIPAATGRMPRTSIILALAAHGGFDLRREGADAQLGSGREAQ